MTAGAPPDFPTLYRSEFAYVWKTLRRLGAPARDMEDLAHDLFVVVHRHLPEYDARRPLRPWLFGIAVRVLSDYRRTFRNSRELLDRRVGGEAREAREAIDGAPSADERLADAQARALLITALDELPLDRRAVLVMHDLDGVGVPEIATALEIPLNTAYSRLRLARADLAAAVRRPRAARGGG
ncbi:MAG TPA: sigma-70 family RNA polymerase sigma factor [Polyangia bacterium]|nr:sigma-70 family RNA polymerase sigma factor [Polyangia bacterium]